jgi:small subunit ribosomal protein S8
MSMTDPIADLLTRIRNGFMAEKRWVDIPSSKMKRRIAFVLKEEHYIKDFIFLSAGEKESIRIFLKYGIHGKPVISGIKRQSKPGCRIYVNVHEAPKVLDGLGIAILSTSKGILSGKTARKLNVGGDDLCSVW